MSTEIPRKERRALHRLKHKKIYTFLLGCFVVTLSPVKYFITLPIAGVRKAFGVISLSVYKALGLRFGYIDDFMVHKKLRGKGYGKKLFEVTEQEAQKHKCDYLVLFSRKDRKTSHRFYKKAGLTIIGLGFGILAYKKLRSKK